MDGKTQIIAEIDSAREIMEAALADFDKNRDIYTSWTAKELVAHLVGWYDVVIPSLHAHASGETPATPVTQGIDHHNAQTVAKREALSYEQIVREWHHSLDQFKQAVKEMPDNRFLEPMVYPWGSRGTVRQFVLIFTDHEREHAEDIRMLMENH